jgi:Ca2+-binding RTX toxin-like protein
MATTLSSGIGAPLLIVDSVASPTPFVVDNAAAAAGSVSIPSAVTLVDVTATIPVTLVGGGGTDTVSPLPTNVTVNGGSGQLTFVGGTGDASIEGGSGSVTLFGGAGGGSATGGSNGGNLLEAGTGATTLYGGGSNSALYAGGSVTDVLYAGLGNQTLVGSLSTGSNIFYAGSGSDSITAGVGNDTIFAGTGSATILGGGGQNTYEFLASMTSSSASVSIGDFHVGTDRLVISGYGTSTDSVYNNRTVASGSTMLTLGDGTKVVLTGVTNLDRASLT